MTATPVQTTLEERVLEWTEKLCEALAENYKQHSIRMYQGGESDYSKKQLESVEDGTWKGMKFVIKNGKKYYKIMQHEYDTYRDRNEYRESSVHAFIDKKTGEVYKPASYKSPAKIVRYDMRLIKDRAKLHNPNFTDWAGGYLYLRG